MKVPNAQKAFVDIRKLTEYCLNPEHSQGKFKARVFNAALGISTDNAAELRKELLKRIISEECTKGISDRYGDRYIVDFVFLRKDKKAEIRSTWIIRKGESQPRLTSCYVL